MPPNKRFREIEHLSGGERTVAALALLFALWRAQPAPLLVMDEVDAALDNVNVTRVAEYIRAQASKVQTIAISLKDTFYDKSDGLVGVYRNVEANSSATVTFDLRGY
ncbi:RecF/RecN/SMC N terminal domain-containing protein [Pavlovales sp. CCMP2436]|nr:RecF/RecN/SMC N terminal domain-containing protein [Pavlovales sp. CCMP2436]